MLYLIRNNNISLLKFNLSRSVDSIIYGFSREVDIGEDIIEYCCSIEEKNKLEELSMDHKYFYKIWVIKESLVDVVNIILKFATKSNLP